ncbi:hypothetical protein L596_009378 [Steinernema carpocapsae]|uniref:Uncharacterized protein n=1 Tax=Steinernema carpocapsae TaxID=34508 RepID=A0A4V6A6P5_STECR|nr:hypothetical protein L596_009378 [Steinernema carpocapsae]
MDLWNEDSLIFMDFANGAPELVMKVAEIGCERFGKKVGDEVDERVRRVHGRKKRPIQLLNALGCMPTHRSLYRKQLLHYPSFACND